MVILGGIAAFTGCQSGNSEEKQGEDLEFTVTGEADIPAALKELIDKKREKPFKLTYADGLEMYIVIGEGPQKGGGYSVAVKELYETDNSIVIRTELTGPEAVHITIRQFTEIKNTMILDGLIRHMQKSLAKCSHFLFSAHILTN